MGCLLEMLVWLVVEALSPVVGWVFTPIWRRFARLVNGWTVLLLWGAAFVAVHTAWTMEASASNLATWGRILLFIVPPVLAIAATVEWRSPGPPAPTPRRRRRASAY